MQSALFQFKILQDLSIFSFIRLHKCKLEGDCCEVLAVALSAESTQLRELDLSANDFQEAGVKALCVGLRSHHCKLLTVRLDLLFADKLKSLAWT